MPPNEHVTNAANLSFAVDIAGVINETPYYSSGSLIGPKPSLIVNVRFLP
jgi:hypothetical protein